MDLRLSGRTAVLTGGAGDMMLETARILQGEGCNLLLTDIDADELKAAAGELGGDVATVVADLSEMSGAEAVARAVADAGWACDILVHGAGVTGAKGDPLDDIGEEDWHHAWNTDFMTAVRMSKALIPGMRTPRLGPRRLRDLRERGAALPPTRWSTTRLRPPS